MDSFGIDVAVRKEEDISVRISEVMASGSIEQLCFDGREDPAALMERYGDLFAKYNHIFDRSTCIAWDQMLVRLRLYKKLGVLCGDNLCVISGMYPDEIRYRFTGRWDIPGGMVMLGVDYIGFYSTVRLHYYCNSYYYRCLRREGKVLRKKLPLRCFEDQATFNSANLLDEKHPMAMLFYTERKPCFRSLASRYKSLSLSDIKVITYFFLKRRISLYHKDYCLVGIVAPLVFLVMNSGDRVCNMMYYGDVLSVVPSDSVIGKLYPFGGSTGCKADSAVSLQVIQRFVERLALEASVCLDDDRFFRVWFGEAFTDTSLTGLYTVLKITLVADGVLSSEESEVDND